VHRILPPRLRPVLTSCRCHSDSSSVTHPAFLPPAAGPPSGLVRVLFLLNVPHSLPVCCVRRRFTSPLPPSLFPSRVLLSHAHSTAARAHSCPVVLRSPVPLPACLPRQLPL
jgi:hypothetical protein